MKIIKNYPAKRTKSSGPLTFLSLPGELRNQIYNLYFAQDMYDSSVGWEGSNRWLITKRPTFFEVLRVNRQIYKEARSIAKREYERQLRLRRQFYTLSTEQSKPVRKWELWPSHEWTPRCRNLSAFAKLQLPIIYIELDVFNNDRIKERLHRLRAFFSEMVRAFQE